MFWLLHGFHLSELAIPDLRHSPPRSTASYVLIRRFSFDISVVGAGGGEFNISFLIFCEIWIQCFQALSKWYSEYGRDNEDNPVSTAANIGDAFIDMSPTQVNHQSTPTQTHFEKSRTDDRSRKHWSRLP